MSGTERTLSYFLMLVAVGALIVILTLSRQAESSTTSQGSFPPEMLVDSEKSFRFNPAHFPTAKPRLPIESSEDATARSMDLLPATIAPTQLEVRLISHAAFAQWTDSYSQGGVFGPIWLVGMLADNLSLEIILGAPSGEGLGFGTSPEPPIIGAFYAWDANGGHLISRGGLADGIGPQFVELVSLPNETLSIQQATEVPTAEIPGP